MDEKTTQTSETVEASAMPERLFDTPRETSGEAGLEDLPGGTLTVKYNGEEKEISLEEAVVLAQKGMNYDHVVAERDTKYQRELDALDRYAARSGMTRSEYLDRLEEDERAQESSPGAHREAVNARENYIAQLEYRLAAAEKETEVRGRALGSAQGDAGEGRKDPFLEGFA